MLSDHYRGGQTESLAVTIVTVDPSMQRVEGVGRDAAAIQISIGYAGPVFRWPEVGEIWSIERRNGIWALSGRIAQVGENAPPNTLSPGALRLDSTDIVNSDGDEILSAKYIPSTKNIGSITGLTSAQIDALTEPDGYSFDGAMVIANDGATVVMLTRRNGAWYRVNMTAV